MVGNHYISGRNCSHNQALKLISYQYFIQEMTRILYSFLKKQVILWCGMALGIRRLALLTGEIQWYYWALSSTLPTPFSYLPTSGFKMSKALLYLGPKDPSHSHCHSQRAFWLWPLENPPSPRAGIPGLRSCCMVQLPPIMGYSFLGVAQFPPFVLNPCMNISFLQMFPAKLSPGSKFSLPL